MDKEQKCKNCISWNKGGQSPGKMPGTRQEYRECKISKIDKSRKVWRSPTDWCDQWKERNE